MTNGQNKFDMYKNNDLNIYLHKLDYNNFNIDLLSWYYMNIKIVISYNKFWIICEFNLTH